MFKRIFLNNWVPKLLSVLLAIMIWFAVSAGEQRVGSFPGGLPVQITNVPEGLIATLDENQVEVSLIADRSLWQRFTVDNFRATVDLSGAEEGVIDKQVTVSSRLPNVEVVSISPASILVRLERLESKEVPVAIQLSGDLASGFAPGQVEINPESVFISGPKSLLEQVDQVVGTIEFSGESEDFETDVELKATAAGKELEALSVEPPVVRVKVPVVRAANVKTVGVTIKKTGNLPNGLFISDINLNPSLVSVTGSTLDLSTLKYVETEALDLSDIRENTSVELNFDLPPGIFLLDSSQKVLVNLTIEQLETTKNLSLFPVLEVPSNKAIISQRPGKIEVELTGPNSIIGELGAAQIGWKIDLTGLDSGTHNIELLPNQFTLPIGVNVSSINPGTIEVEIE